ncbi:hypothetical protein T484DRAFT_1896729, partial [Baffinella frigidus]
MRGGAVGENEGPLDVLPRLMILYVGGGSLFGAALMARLGRDQYPDVFPAGLWRWILALPRLICGFGSSEGGGGGADGDSPLASRRWVHAARTSAGEGEELKIASYNMLADCYVFEDDYPQTPRAALDWGCRRRKLLSELEGLDVDVLCVQEIEQDQFARFFLPELAKRGYEGAFKRRNGPYKRDGCATFWRASRLNLVMEYGLELDTPQGMLGFRLTHNVALMLVLETRPTGGAVQHPSRMNTFLS